MSTIISKLEKIGQTLSVKSEDDIETINQKYKIDLSELYSSNLDLVCGFVPENDDEESDDSSEEEINYK